MQRFSHVNSYCYKIREANLSIFRQIAKSYLYDFNSRISISSLKNNKNIKKLLYIDKYSQDALV